MSAIFISHSSRDHLEAARIGKWLRARGHTSIFLDFDPADGIPPGRNWEREVYANLDACLGVIALCSHASLASKWCFHEIAAARAREVPLFPVRLDDCALPELVAGVQVIDLAPDRSTALERLWRGMLKAGLDPAEIFTWDRGARHERGPYPGLGAFEHTDAAVYFGREGAIREVRAELERQSRQGAGRAVLILGASGAGKSSLMRAGALPRLDREKDRWLALEPFEPQGVLGPLARLAQVLTAADPGGLRQLVARLEEAACRTDPQPLNAEAEMLRLGQARRNATVVLALDQAEQLVGAGRTALGDDFLALLRAALEQPGSPLLLLATLRSDHLGAWQEHPALQGMSFGSITVGPLAAEGFRKVIELPAQVHGLRLELGLADAIIADLGTSTGALPLLAFALRELYERCGRAAGCLTIEDYQCRLRGISGSIERKADEIWADWRPDAAQQEALRRLFVGLARLNDDGGFVRRRRPWAEVDPALAAFVGRLVDAHLLVSDREERPDGAGEATLAVAHEALFQAWPRLRGWLEAARQDHADAAWVRGLMLRWQRAGGTDENLLRPGRELAQGRAVLLLQDVPVADLPPFVERSLAVEQQRQAALEEARERERAARAAARRQGHLIAEAQLSLAEGDATLALLLALEAIASARTAGEGEPQSEATLLQAILALRECRILQADEPLNQALFAPDGATVLTLGRDGTAGLWRTADGALQHRLRGHAGQLLRGAFDPLGQHVATASSDGTSRLFEVATGMLCATLQGHEGALHGIAFAPDGASLVTASADRTARLWSAAGTLLATLAGHADAVMAAVFAPDGRTVLTASADRTARLWDVGTGACRACLAGHEGPLYNACFSPDGEWVATASWDWTARLWQATSGALLAILRGHQGGVEAVAFAPDGALLATGSEDTTVRLWTCPGGDPVGVLAGHTGQVFDASFAPDGRRLASAADDGSVRVWDLASAAHGDAGPVMRSHAGAVWSSRFAADGHLLVSAGEDGAARLFDLAAGEPAAVLDAHNGEVYNAIFAADGQEFATAGEDGLVRLWAIGDRAPPTRALGVHDGAVWSLAYAPDGTRLLTASADGTAKLWARASSACLRTFAGHDGPVTDAAFAPSGELMATCGEDATARVWAVASGGQVAKLEGHRGLLRQVLFTPDGARVVTASDDGTARLWAIPEGRLIAVLEGHQGAVVKLAIAADGGTIATASLDGTVALYDAASGARRRVLSGHRNQVWHVAFAPAGELLVSASHDNRARLWHSGDGALVTTLSGHHGRVVDAAFDPTGRLLLTASWDRTARLWHAATGHCVMVFADHRGPLHRATFSPDGRRVLTAAADGTARLYVLPVGPADDWVAHAQSVAPRPLSDDERRRYA